MKKHTYEFIQQKFKNKNFKLQSTEYINNKSKLDVICHNGHNIEIRWNDFQQGVGCPVCVGNQTHDYNFIKQQIEMDGSCLLNTEYINAHTKLKLICPKKTWTQYHLK